MKLPPILPVLLLLCLFTGLLHAQPTLEGSIDGLLESGTYLVIDTLRVDLDDTLRIQPGTELRFEAWTVFICRGLLLAEGTEADSILFYADDPDSGWSGITFLNPSSDNSSLAYCRISDSGETGLTFLHGAAVVDHSVISGNQAGGIRCESYSSPSFNNCKIMGNSSYQGGGLYTTFYSFPSFTDCQISRNSSSSRGGGLYAINHAFPVLIRCRIEYNYAGTDGGGLAYNIVTWNATIDETVIAHNTAGSKGGALFCRWHGGPTIHSTLIVNNEAAEGGHAIDASDSHFTMINCTLASNQGDGEAVISMHDGGGIEMRNTILFNHGTPEIAFEDDGTTYDLVVGYSDLEGGEQGIVGRSNTDLTWLEGNLDADPRFLDPESEDYRLSVESPCIDAGDPNDSVDPDGTRIDMGAIPYQQASASPEAGTESNSPSGITLHISPNPFNSSTRISVGGTLTAGIEVRVYNLLGQMVDHLSGNATQGNNRVYVFSTENLSTGTYFVVASRENQIMAHKRIVLIK